LSPDSAGALPLWLKWAAAVAASSLAGSSLQVELHQAFRAAQQLQEPFTVSLGSPRFPWIAATAPMSIELATPATEPPQPPVQEMAPAARMDAAKDISGQVVAVGPIPAAELEERRSQVTNFTPTVRRDIFNVLLNPYHPYEPVASSTAAANADGEVAFEVSLWVKLATVEHPACCAFRTRAAGTLFGYKIASEQQMINSIGMIGKADEQGYALTTAFESFVSAAAKGWEPQQTSHLSVEFLVAFGRELGRRLDITHRIRSSKLSADELNTLKTPPFSTFVNQWELQMFQNA